MVYRLPHLAQWFLVFHIFHNVWMLGNLVQTVLQCQFSERLVVRVIYRL